VVGADALSRYLDPEDRGSAMLFGANGRILRAVAQRLEPPDERVAAYVDRYANTSAASLPIALAAAAGEGRLRAGARVLVAAFGAGLAWGGGVVTWRSWIPRGPRARPRRR
jgi:3-oxoacyl-[acyl-carrier-protein] synthase III